MLGAIAGDMIGSIHEFTASPSADVPLFQAKSHFTDDSLLTLATAECLLTGRDYADAYRQAFLDNRGQAWGGGFAVWAAEADAGPYDSFGNGSAMRVSPVGYWARSEADVLVGAERSAEVTHNHPEGIRGAQATAMAIWLARQDMHPDAIRDALEARFGFALGQTVEDVRRSSRYNETCQGTVPPALIIALEAQSFEQAMRMALSLDADSDTLACIVGGIAQARFGVPEWMEQEVRRRLLPEQVTLLERFTEIVEGK